MIVFAVENAKQKIVTVPKKWYIHNFSYLHFLYQKI